MFAQEAHYRAPNSIAKLSQKYARMCTLSCAVEPPFIPIRQHPILSFRSMCVCDLFVCVRVSRNSEQNTPESTWINRRLPVILFSCKSVKFPSMWKFYFAVDKNMRARRLIKKRLARVCHRRHYILFPLEPAAAQIACVILRAASQYISANWLFIYFVRGCARGEYSVVFLSTHARRAIARKYE